MGFGSSFLNTADFTTLSMAAAAISVIASSMLIMISRLFALKDLEQVAKTEFVYAASTVFIVVMVLAIVNVGERALAAPDSSLARSLYLISFGCPVNSIAVFDANTLIDWMKLYLETPAKCVQSFMVVLYGLSVPVEAMASVYMEIFMSEHASGFGVKWIAERITNTTQSMSFYMYMFYLLVHVLNFVKGYAGFFFSIGVILRAFPPTRGGGAYLMAISFGLYFVFPLAYILVATMALPPSDIVVPEMTTDMAGSQVCQSRDGNFQYICALPEVTSPQDYGCGASIGKMNDFQAQLEENASILENMFNSKILSFTRHLISAICILPMISMVILLTFVLNATNLFGGNIPEIGRGLVKLI
ncbi:hypothetical protein JXA56_02230 [Candidatus Micrarchaeota archaeon]|nr:hypothetical protein [Candidatus Micrarchaeota archaeon]